MKIVNWEFLPSEYQKTAKNIVASLKKNPEILSKSLLDLNES